LLDEYHSALMDAISHSQQSLLNEATLRAASTHDSAGPGYNATETEALTADPERASETLPLPVGRSNSPVESQDEPASPKPSSRQSIQRSPFSESKARVSRLVEQENQEVEDETANCRSRTQKFLQGRFSKFVGFCIIANTITMFVHLQFLGEVANADLGLPSGSWPGAATAFEVMEYFFCGFFFLELLAQLFAYGLAFLGSSVNILDFAIVLITSLDVFLLSHIATASANISFVRMIRLFKLIRAFRVVRTLKRFEGLRVLLGSIVYSLPSLFWAMVIMLLCQVMMAIFLCQTLHDYITDQSTDVGVRMLVNDMYGSGTKALFTVFMMTFSGCWPNYTQPLIEHVSWLYSIATTVYIFFVAFAMSRIVSALFLKETLQQASWDAEMMVAERQKKTQVLTRELNELFDQADTSGDGLLTLDELNDILAHPNVRLWLSELGVDVTDTTCLFELLDDGDGSVTRDEFVAGITKLKGEARAQDLVPVVTNCQRILGHCKALRHTCEEIAQNMDSCKSLAQELRPHHNKMKSSLRPPTLQPLQHRRPMHNL